MWRPVLRNAASLYGVQLVSYLIPILEVPILARSLGAELYGEVLICQALALTLSVLVEYGFNINAAQQVAVNRSQPIIISLLFGDILLAKVLLALPIIALLVFFSLLGLIEIHSPLLIIFVLVYFCAFGFSPSWYFQGMERLGKPAILDVVLRLCGLTLLALLIEGPEDFLLALPLLATPPLLNTVFTNLWARKELGTISWSINRAWMQLRNGFHFFIFRSAGSLILAAAPMMLGVAAGNRAVGEFGPSEKLVRGMTSLALPFLTAAFPSFSRVFSSRSGGYRSAWIVLGIIAVLAFLGMLMGYLLGGWALSAMLGNGYEGAMPIYLVLLWLVPLRIMNQSLAMILLIPAGRAKAASYLLTIVSSISILIGTILAFYWGGLGMAKGLLAGEIALFLAQILLAIRITRASATSN